MAIEITHSLYGRLFGLDRNGFYGNAKAAKVDVAQATASSTLENFGLSTVGSSTGTINYTLAAPEPGVVKTITVTAATTELSRVSASTTGAITFDGTNFIATLNGANDVLHLIGVTATRWAILGNTGSVGIATT